MKDNKSTFILRLTLLAWKNIWRNKVRSGIILGAIATGLFGGTALLSIMEGWVLSTVKSDIENQYSHLQMHDTAFLANYDINACFDREAVEQKINSSDLPGNVAFRLNLTGIIASPYNTVGVTAKAVIPDEEKQVTTVWQQIPDTLGTYFAEDVRNPIVISKKIADKLKVKLRSKIVFTFQDAHGDMQSIAFRVGGIYKTSNGMFDAGNVFVRYDDIFGYTGLPFGAVHESAVRLANIEECNLVAPQYKNLFSDMDVQDWSELNSGLALSLKWTMFMGPIMLSIFLLALAFGIINTMLMAVLERTREIGMLGAIGMSKGKIFSMIMYETMFLTLLGAVVGIVVAVASIYPTLENGIDLSGFIGDDFEDFGYSSIIYPIFNVRMMVQIVVLVIITGILSAIYPARKALKLKSLEAIRQV